jgi:hypothetical protein
VTRQRSLRRRARVASIAVAVLMTVSSNGSADAGKGPSATEIVDKMIDADPLGYGGAEAQIVMALVNNRGQTQKRKVVMFSRKDDKVRRLFLRFLTPSDIAGTSFLGIDDDGKRIQHLYMPSLARTRRISSQQRNASFVGTDYSYADLDNRDIDDSTKKRLADEKVAGQDCYMVSAVPKHKDSSYGRIDMWISQKTYLPVRIRFYGKNGAEAKRLTVKEIKKVGKRWLISESKMVDLKREHTTVFKLTDITLKDDIDLEQFTVRALERG